MILSISQINALVSNFITKGSKVFWIDLFAGFGGESTGIKRAKGEVLIAVNHNKNAIASHKANYPDVIHAAEDIIKMDLTYVKMLVNEIRKRIPGAIICFWASPDCKHFSKAKGGESREADNRTLAEELYRYIEEIQPDYVDVENVMEFLSWGPLRIACEKETPTYCTLKVRNNGKYHMIPESKNNGKFYMRWHQHICSKYGYEYSYKIFNCADFGAKTSRIRYFGQFKKPHHPFTWPTPTHCKNPINNGLFESLKPWNPCGPELDLNNVGESIFTRSKPYKAKTYERIYNGLIRHGLKDNHYFTKYYGTGKNVASIKTTAPTVTCKDRFSIVFLKRPLNGFAGRIPSIQLNGLWLDKQYSGERNHQSINVPAGSILCNNKLNLAATWVMNHNFNNAGSPTNQPCPTLLASRRHYYLLNPQFGNTGQSIVKPCFTLIARMDKKPPYLTCTTTGKGVIVIYEDDLPIVKKIKLVMAENGIVDISMRMLTILELLRIQGFNDNYKLVGTATEHKEFIGNSVPPDMAEAIALSRVSFHTKKDEKTVAA